MAEIERGYIYMNVQLAILTEFLVLVYVVTYSKISLQFTAPVWILRLSSKFAV